MFSLITDNRLIKPKSVYLDSTQRTDLKMQRQDFELVDRSHSFQVPSGSNYVESRRSRSLNYGVNIGESMLERPNMVISGHKKFHKAYFTAPRGNIDSHANRIVAKLEENDALMDDTPVSEQLRKEALRDLPQCLTMKRCVKMKLSKSVSQKSKKKPISFWKRTKYRIKISYSKFVTSLKNFNYFELWHSTLKSIEGRFGSGYASYFKFLRWLFIVNFFIAVFPLIFLVVPQVIYDVSGTNGTTKNSQRFYFRDIFVGDGYFAETVLYYGHYTDNSIDVIPHFLYDMPAAYFTVFVILYLLQFVILAVSVAQLYRRTFIETEGGFQNVFANKIFCGWDWGIATEEAAKLKHSSIYHELKELLSEENKFDEDKTCLFKFWTYTIQIVVNVLVLVILAGVGWLTWTLLDKFAGQEGDTIILNAVIANLIIMTFPTIFSYISKYEDYNSPRTVMYITLIRTYLLGGVIIGTTLTFWLRHAGKTNCWENGLGAEIYRLIVFDFLFSVILSIFIDIGYFIGRYFSGKTAKSEFNVAKNTLQIIYNQGLFWVGFFYSPILPIIVTIKMLIIWYVREISVQKLCRPPKRTWRAAQAQTSFMMMIFVSVLLIIAAHGYSLKSVQSSSCGPFKNYNYTYEIVTNSVDHLIENDFWRVVMNVFKPGGIAIIMMGLIILVYYLRKQAFATKEKVKMLRETLVWIAKDKKFLVQWYNDITKEDINPHYRNNRFVDPSKVLPQEYVDDQSISSISEDEFNYRFKKYS